MSQHGGVPYTTLSYMLLKCVLTCVSVFSESEYLFIIGVDQKMRNDCQ